MSTDAIVLLKNDHKEVKKLFRQFERAGDTATAQKGEIVSRIIELLTMHTYIENEVMYPEVRKLLPDLDDDVLESYEEHHVADVLCLELYAMRPDNEHFDAKATVLIENVEHHIGEEEQDWFPKVRDGLTRKQLQEIGARMDQLKKSAPKSPVDPRHMTSAKHAITA
jgi:hemerythrin superfamily protein